MPGKKCCIDKCSSSSVRHEDLGVTYHKFPKVAALRESWLSVTQQSPSNKELVKYVCSRHFRKTDFQHLRDSKYALKPDAVPSIFPWNLILKMEGNEENNSNKTVEDKDQYNKKDSHEVKISWEHNKTNAVEQLVKCSENDNTDGRGMSLTISHNDNTSSDTSKNTTNNENKELDPTTLTNRENEGKKNVYQSSDVSENENRNVSNANNSKDEFIDILDKHVSNTNENSIIVDEPLNSNTVDESLNSSKESDSENLDAIKKFIADQEKEIEHQQKHIKNRKQNKIFNEDSPENCENKTNFQLEDKVHDVFNNESNNYPDEETSENLAVASSLMDMILNQSVTAIAEKKESHLKESPDEKGNNSVALTVGSEVEARDFSEYWYPAKIVEVDYEEMEVLVHYENISKKHDEWISVSSPRLRPIGSSADKLKDAVKSDIELTDCKNIKQEPTIEEKPKLMFVVGERCLARWRDNRRFIATIQKDLGGGQYEIMFDDGFHWTCPMSRLYKFKQSLGKNSDPINIGPSTSYSSSPNPSSVTCSTPSTNVTAVPNLPQIPPYHKHLFDPTRDYLGSKSERREMKRKLNIKEIFNIGQKRRKIDPTPTETSTKIVKTKRPNIIKRSLVIKPEVRTKKEIKKEIPDAVAAIIGTAPPKEDFTCIKTDDYSKVNIKTEVIDVKDNIDKEHTLSSNQDELIADPIEEEAKLEKFEKQDQQKHEQVIDKIKEVIIKLEDVINKDVNLESPKIIKKHSMESNLDVQKHVIEDMNIDSSKDKNEDIEPASMNDLNLDSEKNDGKYIIVGSPKESAEVAKLECQKATDVSRTDNLKSVENIEEVPKPENNVEQKLENPNPAKPQSTTKNIKDDEKPKKNILKVKKCKKLRLLQEKKVKKQVEKVKSELEEMKKQVEEMKKQMLLKTTELASCHHSGEMPESFLLPGEWCCKWVNGQPVGTVSEVVGEVKTDANNKPMLPRRSVQVEDKRLPPGWTKHMVRRSWGNSAGKWDVVLVSPENRRLHTRAEMRNYLENAKNDSLKPFEHALYDFGIHLKLARRMGWDTNTPDGAVQQPVTRIPIGLFRSRPIVKQSASVKRKLGLNKRVIKVKTKKRLVRPAFKAESPVNDTLLPESTQSVVSLTPVEVPTPGPALEDGYVYVGSLKVQVIENLLRCPAEGCFKNFRNNTLIKMHIKHYHRELVRMLGATPKVLDLAYARTIPNVPPEPTRHKNETESKTIKVKLPKVPKRDESRNESKDVKSELQMSLDSTMEHLNALDSPKLRSTLVNRPVKRPRVLLPVRRPDPEEVVPAINEELNFEAKDSPSHSMESVEPLDFETAISTHTVTKPINDSKKKAMKHRSFASIQKGPVSEEDEWVVNSDLDTRSSFPRSGTPDSKMFENKLDGPNQAVSSESNDDQKGPHTYMYTESGERIKIVHMKREEIINCHCGVREEDGLMVQCELCLCWQHALCHNIQKESEVPEKYTCSICLNPRRGRRRARFLHDQDRMYEGLLPGAPPCETLRRSHELSGNLLKIQDALHALRVKSYVATKKNHPKLYLWAKDWENGELNMIQEKLNSDYSDLNIMISDIGKENLPLKPDEIPLGMGSPPSEEAEGDRYLNREGQIGSQSLLSGLLSSPGGASLDLPISTSDLDKLATSVQEQEGRSGNMAAPQPEAAIENSACRERLLRHIQRCQAVIDSRLDSIEAQVAELESQDPSFEDDETAEFFPRTKQTVQMLTRDLDTMEELGIIT